MRTLMIAGLSMVTAIAATQAGAQHVLSNGQVWQNGHVVPPATVSPNMPANQRPMPARQRLPLPNGVEPGPQNSGGGHVVYPNGYPSAQNGTHRSRWGGSVSGHWQGGAGAPGGWNAYRRPHRGWVLPSYWIAPSFFIYDYGTYGLSAPPQGYHWSRYYDDAVLMDQRGRVMDSVSGIDWDSYDDGYGYAGGYAEAGDGYAAAAGGGGGYGASYAPPVQYQQGPAYPPPVQNGYTTTWSSGGAYAGSGGYVSGGYWYPPATTTTVTIQSAPVVTTTTTEYVETTRYVPARRAYRAKRVVRRRSCCCCCCR
ncbi:RcnB family protein [Sphingomonas oligophenolica]|uniref:RcnB family protein n=1 Tax=Sphingomonas oligophenolica TaxID=301154 RepID=A0ABU9Y1F6_9SPHN